jgi:hypothetical protein
LDFRQVQNNFLYLSWCETLHKFHSQSMKHRSDFFLFGYISI